MTDEFYACKNCGAFEAGTYTKYSISGIGASLTKDELDQIEDIVGKDYDCDETIYCSICDEEYDSIMVANTER